MRNEVILDGVIKRDIQSDENEMRFCISTKDDIATTIKVVYQGIDNDIIQEGQNIRIYGKLSSEKFIAKSGKPVFNKILLAESVEKLD